jgi:hypothetical protein
MLSINDRLGFKLFEQYVFYKIRVDDLAAKIDKVPWVPVDPSAEGRRFR